MQFPRRHFLSVRERLTDLSRLPCKSLRSIKRQGAKIKRGSHRNEIAPLEKALATESLSFSLSLIQGGNERLSAEVTRAISFIDNDLLTRDTIVTYTFGAHSHILLCVS